jgi:NTE family protein
VKLALVLGAGGLVGVAHHVGVLRALEDETGIGEPEADLVVGTSAGSAIGAYLRSGWTTTDLIERAADLRRAAPGRTSSSALDAVRHGVGSAYIVARTAVRFPSPLSLPPLGPLRRAFPAGLVTMGGGGGMLERELPRAWPERRLWLASYDLVGRRRVVLGRPGEPYVALPTAVKASCAIPGVYAPVRVADSVLVDGGAWSLTNVDLAALAGCRAVVCIAPMSFDPHRPPAVADRLVREVSTRLLFRTVARLKRQGVKVVVVAPGPREVHTHGLNLMRSRGLEEVALVAYEDTVAAIRLGRLGHRLAALDLPSSRADSSPFGASGSPRAASHRSASNRGRSDRAGSDRAGSDRAGSNPGRSDRAGSHRAGRTGGLGGVSDEPQERRPLQPAFDLASGDGFSPSGPR